MIKFVVTIMNETQFRTLSFDGAYLFYNTISSVKLIVFLSQVV